jgi:hypothetical protein
MLVQAQSQQPLLYKKTFYIYICIYIYSYVCFFCVCLFVLFVCCLCFFFFCLKGMLTMNFGNCG